MAFTSLLQSETVEGNHRVKYFTFSSVAVTGGTINHGLKGVINLGLTNSVSSGGSVSTSGDIATLANLTAGDTGYLMVVGL